MPKEIPQYLLASRIEAENRVGVGPEIWAPCDTGHLTRSPQHAQDRRAVVVELRRMGHSFPEIAEVCGICHSSAIYMVREYERDTGEIVVAGSRPPNGVRLSSTKAWMRTAPAPERLSDHEFAEAVRDAWRCYAVFRDTDSLKTLFGILDDDAARHDPHYQPIRQRRSA